MHGWSPSEVNHSAGAESHSTGPCQELDTETSLLQIALKSQIFAKWQYKTLPALPFMPDEPYQLAT